MLYFLGNGQRLSIVMGAQQSIPQEEALGFADDTQSLLYESFGNPCSFSDQGYFIFRLKQLEIMNYIIRKMTKILCLPADTIDYERLIHDIMTFKVFEQTNASFDAKDYDYSLLSLDETFRAPVEEVNKFAELTNYMKNNAGRSSIVMKADFDKYLVTFIKLRDVVLQELVRGCE